VDSAEPIDIDAVESEIADLRAIGSWNDEDDALFGQTDEWAMEVYDSA
jgi:hypothetical protein